MAFSSVATDTADAILKRNSTTATQPVFTGIEVLDGTPAWTYTFTWETHNAANQLVVVPAKIWIGIADGLPRQIEGDTAKAPKTHYKVVFQYDPNIKVTAPI